MLKGQKLNVVVLLDSDSEGKRARDDLVRNKMLKESNVVYVSEAARNNREMELEDLFPEEFYVKYVNESYKEELGNKKVPLPVPGNHPLIRRKLEDLFQSYGLIFHKTRPARKMLEEFSTLQPSNLPQELVDNTEKFFDLINSRMPK